MILNSSYEEAVVAFIKDMADTLFARGSYTGKKNDLMENEGVITKIAYRAQKDCEEYGYSFGDAIEEVVMEYLSLPKEDSDNLEEVLEENGHGLPNPEPKLEDVENHITYNEIIKCLSTENRSGFWTNGEDILCQKKHEAEVIADFLESIGVLSAANTGYFDPEEDKRNGERDCCTGWYYVH